jgi:hypothetical protein
MADKTTPAQTQAELKHPTSIAEWEAFKPAFIANESAIKRREALLPNTLCPLWPELPSPVSAGIFKYMDQSMLRMLRSVSLATLHHLRYAPLTVTVHTCQGTAQLTPVAHMFPHMRTLAPQLMAKISQMAWKGIFENLAPEVADKITVIPEPDMIDVAPDKVARDTYRVEYERPEGTFRPLIRLALWAARMAVKSKPTEVNHQMNCAIIAMDLIEHKKRFGIPDSNDEDVQLLAEARECLEAAQLINPQHLGMLGRLGVVAERQGRLDEAATFYASGIQDKPGDTVVKPVIENHLRLGSLRYKAGDAEGFRTHFDTAVKLLSSEYPYIQRARAHRDLGLLKEYEADMTQAAKIMADEVAKHAKSNQ